MLACAVMRRHFSGARGSFTRLNDERVGPAPHDGGLDQPSSARLQPVSARSDGLTPDIMAPYTHDPLQNRNRRLSSAIMGSASNLLALFRMYYGPELTCKAMFLRKTLQRSQATQFIEFSTAGCLCSAVDFIGFRRLVQFVSNLL